MTNYMREIARLLGVELGESFKLVDDNGGKYHNYYRFTNEKGIEESDDNDNWESAIPGILKWILMGEIRIIKLPWKPKMHEEYYIPCIHHAESSMCSVYPWHGDKVDNKLYQLGLVCKTREEAVAMTKKMITMIQEEKKNEQLHG